MADENVKCDHSVSLGRSGELGSWCKFCGEQTYAVDPRPCKDCNYFKPLYGGPVCKKHLMGVTANMRVTYKVSKGSCWAEKRLLTVARAELTTFRMAAGNEKKYPAVIIDGRVKEWVGLGWIDARATTLEDLATLPVVVD